MRLASISAEQRASLYDEVRSVLEEALSLGRRAHALQPESRLLGALPELDSQAVVSVLLAMEERFRISIADDDVTADTFATLDSLTALVARNLRAVPD
jgi:acyl carrier protein